MHGSRRHRDLEARAPWTKRQLISYKCTLYLFIVFGLELRSSAPGEEQTWIDHFICACFGFEIDLTFRGEKSLLSWVL